MSHASSRGARTRAFFSLCAAAGGFCLSVACGSGNSTLGPPGGGGSGASSGFSSSGDSSAGSSLSGVGSSGVSASGGKDDGGVSPMPEAGLGDDGSSQTSGVFRHPGALVNGEQLAFLKAKIAAAAEPWTSALAATKADPLGSLSYAPNPPADSNGAVNCATLSGSDVHCKDEQHDSEAAYAHALISALTGDPKYTAKAIEIMNAWSAVMKTHTDSNSPVQSGWTGTLFARAAEIIRYTSTAWAAADIAKFSSMLKSAYVPFIQSRPGMNGNWELSMADALIQIAVFNDDRPAFDHAIAMWKRRVPEYIYMSSDGPTPVMDTMASTWNASKYYDGLCQETCRDLGHTQYGFAAIINVAETARIQGVDLYTLEAKRITAGLEVHAGYINAGASSSPACSLSAVSPDPMWEIAYNEYANRLKMALPNTAQLVKGNRPTGVNHHMDWETLTHAEVGSVGIH